jgi:hypothetical protein
MTNSRPAIFISASSFDADRQYFSNIPSDPASEANGRATGMDESLYTEGEGREGALLTCARGAARWQQAQARGLRHPLHGQRWPQHERLPVLPLHRQDRLVHAMSTLLECFRLRVCMCCIRVTLLASFFLCAGPEQEQKCMSRWSTTATSRPVGLDKWGPVLAERYWGPLPPMKDGKSDLVNSLSGRTRRPGMPAASKSSASTKPPLPIASPLGSLSSPPKASSWLGASSREFLLSVPFPCLPHMPSLISPHWRHHMSLLCATFWS